MQRIADAKVIYYRKKYVHAERNHSLQVHDPVLS